MNVQENDEDDDLAAIQGVAERLKAAVRLSGGNKEIARASGVPLRTLNSYMAGEADPKLTKLDRIAVACGTTVDALLGRKPPSTPEGPRRTTLTWMADADRSTGAPRVGTDRRETPLPDGFVAVPFFDARAPAGHERAGQATEAAAFRFLLGEAWLRSLGVTSQTIELRPVRGDSMAPTLQHGDLMLIDRGYRQIVHGKIYAFVVDDLVVVKRVSMLAAGGMILLSDNDRYPTESIHRDDVGTLTFLGRVAWYGRTI